MANQFKRVLEKETITASAPCRVDMGGTVDLSTFYYPLRHLSPCTFNLAIDLKTKVSLYPYDDGKVKITSRGFKSATYRLEKAPFTHPLGLMFAIAAYFHADGIHVVVDSTSPPRSALGGSSAAAVALIAAFCKLFRKVQKPALTKMQMALLAHAIESSVAGLPCGLQDQLAAVYGGVNAWYWHGDVQKSEFKRQIVLRKSSHPDLEPHLLLAYCGIPHESKAINSTWVDQFLSGKHREDWREIIYHTKRFIRAVSEKDFQSCAESLRSEMRLRKKMTPEVLDDMGEKLVRAAETKECGARFTGAGGGGCVWAIGKMDNIRPLKVIWEKRLKERSDAALLKIKIDSKGVL